MSDDKPEHAGAPTPVPGADPRILTLAVGVIFTVGPITAMAAVLATMDTFGAQQIGQLANALGAFTIGVITFMVGQRLPPRAFHVIIASGTLLLSGFIYFNEDPTAILPSFYTWLGLASFYFFPRREALLQIAGIAVAYGVVVALQMPPGPVGRLLVTVVTPLVTGLIVSVLLDQIRARTRETQRQADALAASEERARRVIETSHDAFLSLDEAGIVREWNAAAERDFGWRREEAVGQFFWDLVGRPEERADHEQRRRRLFEEQEEHAGDTRFERVLRRRDGSLVPVEVTAARVKSGETFLVHAFLRDISERKRADEERERLVREQAAREEAEQIAETVNKLQRVTEAALSELSLRDLARTLTDQIAEVLEVAATSVLLHHEDDEELVLYASTHGMDPCTLRVPVGDGIAGRAAAERRTVYTARPTSDDLAAVGLAGIPPSPLLAVPLSSGEEPSGVLVAAAGPRGFTDDDRALLELAADRVAMAVDHARLYERERGIAETLQRSLLPRRLPALPGLGVAVRYIPARAEAEVGGDFYDVMTAPDGTVELAIGDVGGKGLLAASMVGTMRNALRAYTFERLPPAEVMDRLNRLVRTEFDPHQIATLLLAVFDPAEGALRGVSAGHPPPLVLAGGSAEFIEAEQCPPLGTAPYARFVEFEASLAPGDSLLLYTDGLIERRGSNIDAGMARLRAAVRDTPGSPEELCDGVLEKVMGDEAPEDDIALLAMNNAPVGRSFRIDLPAEPESLVSARHLVRRWLRQRLMASEDEIAEITLAVGEAGTNVVKHALDKGTTFELRGTIQDGGVEFVIRDFGRWRAPREDDYGRGFMIMSTIMDSVDVTQGADGTSVTLRRRPRFGPDVDGVEPAEGEARESSRSGEGGIRTRERA